MKKFCIHPWTGLDINNRGKMKPCCKYEEKRDPLFQEICLGENTVSDFKHSTWLKQLQQDFINNKQPEGCIRCWEDENAGIASKRQLDYDRWKDEFSTMDLTNPEYKIIGLSLGNLCNLKCRICSPYNSTAWISEFHKIYGEKHKEYSWYKNKECWTDFITNLTSPLEIHISGGEPFLIDIIEHIEFLQHLVDTGASQKIRLHYSTNCTIFPDAQYWDLWKDFMWVDIQPSIDDFGVRFEYNRYPAKWDEVENNLLMFRDKIAEESNLQLSIATCVSAYTIFYLEEFFDWIYKNNLPKPWLGRVHQPYYMDCSVLPDNAKSIIKEKLKNSKHPDIKNTASWLYANSFEPSLYKQFVNTNKAHDSYRNMLFENTFVELAEILKS